MAPPRKAGSAAFWLVRHGRLLHSKIIADPKGLLDGQSAWPAGRFELVLKGCGQPHRTPVETGLAPYGTTLEPSSSKNGKGTTLVVPLSR